MLDKIKEALFGPKIISPLPESGGLSQVKTAVKTGKKPNPQAAAIQKYFESINAPVATLSADFVRESQKYPITQQNPYLMPAISMLETTGGKNQSFDNNPLNWGIYEPTFQPTNPQQVIERATSGIGKRMGAYEQFRKSGNLDDFASRYAPPSDNNSPDYGSKLRQIMAEISKYE